MGKTSTLPAQENSNPVVASAALGLYVHIPFCRHKCDYCDFNSGPFNRTARQTYLRSLQQEILSSPWRHSMVKTVYFGGGTPSELSPDELGALVLALKQSFLLGWPDERTIECNPSSVTPAYWRSLRAMGFNRISLGVQSFRDDHLQKLGRLHSATDAREAFRWAREAGFNNINVDLLFALPGQTLPQWESDLREAIGLSPEHLSLYNLTVEPGTRFAHRLVSGQLREIDEDLSAAMYERAMDLTAEAGYLQYEISNYAKPGRQSAHNLIYWRNEPYLGFGLSAASFIGGARWTNSEGFADYWRRADMGRPARRNEERLEGPAALGEEIMLRLHTEEGFSASELSLRYSCDVSVYFGEALQFLSRQGLLEQDQDWIRLTRRGKLLANEVCLKFLA